MSLPQPTLMNSSRPFQLAFSSQLGRDGFASFDVADVETKAYALRGTAKEVATEIMMLAIIYNNCACSGSYGELARFWDADGVRDLGLRFDVQGRIHADAKKIEQAYNRNSEKLQHLMTALWGTVEIALMGYQNDPI